MIFRAIGTNKGAMMKAEGKPTMAELQSAAKLLTDAGVDPGKITVDEEFVIDTTLQTVSKQARTTEPPR